MALPGHVVVIKSLPGQRCSAAGMQGAVSVPVPVFGKASRGRTWICCALPGSAAAVGSHKMWWGLCPGAGLCSPIHEPLVYDNSCALGTVWGGAAHPDPLPWG